MTPGAPRSPVGVPRARGRRAPAHGFQLRFPFSAQPAGRVRVPSVCVCVRVHVCTRFPHGLNPAAHRREDAPPERPVPGQKSDGAPAPVREARSPWPAGRGPLPRLTRGVLAGCAALPTNSLRGAWSPLSGAAVTDGCHGQCARRPCPSDREKQVVRRWASQCSVSFLDRRLYMYLILNFLFQKNNKGNSSDMSSRSKENKI